MALKIMQFLYQVHFSNLADITLRNLSP